MISDGTYITIQGWMRTDLKLSGNELIVYAIIYGFSQNKQGEFTIPSRLDGVLKKAYHADS